MLIVEFKRRILLLLQRARLAVSSLSAKLSGCWLQANIYCTDMRVVSFFSFDPQQECIEHALFSRFFLSMILFAL